MERKISILICCFLFHFLSVLCQCLEGPALWKRLIFLRDSSHIPAKEKLAELLQYESTVTNCKYRNDSVRALLLQRIGDAYYKSADFLQAENYINAAIKILHDSAGKPFINTGHLIRNFFILSLIYDSLNRSFEHIKAEDSCISVSVLTGTKDVYLLFILRKKAEYYYYIGDYQRCINYAKEGELITSKIFHSNDSLQYLMQFITWKVNSLRSLNLFDEAEKILENKIKESNKIDLSVYLGNIYALMAAVKTHKSRYNEALYYFNESISRDKVNKNYMSSLQTMVNMGFNLYDNSLHDSKNALMCYNKALHFASLLANNASPADSNQLKIEVLNIYINIANIYVKSGRFDSAEIYFQKAFSQIDVSLDNINFYDNLYKEVSINKSIFWVINGLLDVGESLLKEYKALGGENKLQKAVRIFYAADKIQFQHHIDQTEVQSKLFWRNLLHRLYELGIETSYLLGNKETAFQYFEKSRAILLNDQLTSQQLFSDNDIFKLAQLNKKILNLSRELDNQHDSSIKYKSLQDEIFANKQELNILEQTIKNKYPIYYQTILDTNSIYLKDVRNSILKKQDVLLELFNGDSAVYVIIVTPKQCFLNKIDKKDFDKTADLYTSIISDQALVNSKYDLYLHTASHLYELIFQNNSVPNGRIIISPDGKYFPFEALISTGNIPAPQYFLNDHVVSYTYSTRFLLNDFSKNRIATNGNFLGLAPVEYPAAFQLSALPQSDISLEIISSYFGKSLNMTASLASKNNFLNRYAGYKIIQLYTHASEAGSNGEPVIYFADSALFLSELIPENKMTAQLFVLSACETANGKLYKGEGVFSFNRGLAALGIPSSVTNLWSVDNESTYRITELFYKYVSKGLPLDVALQKAKLEFIASSSKEKKLPYYWAAAILVGKVDKIEINKGIDWKYFILDMIILVIAYFTWMLIKYNFGKNRVNQYIHKR